jgi:hypothetical protein
MCGHSIVYQRMCAIQSRVYQSLQGRRYVSSMFHIFHVSLKVPKDCDEDSKWLIQKLADTTATEPRSRFPKELSLTGTLTVNVVISLYS